MIIAVDLDEVLCAYLDAFLTFYNHRNGTTWRTDAFRTYDFWKTLGGTREEFDILLDEFGKTSLFTHAPPFEEALPAIRHLAEEHTLILVTARPQKLEAATKAWLAEHFPDIFTRVYLTNQYQKLGYWRSKADVCVEEHVDLLIDDSKEYATECAAAGVRVLLLDKPWNQGALPANVQRVVGWDGIRDALNRRAA